jgi:hypothetical protein
VVTSSFSLAAGGSGAEMGAPSGVFP